jgi:hypothetical protein
MKAIVGILSVVTLLGCSGIAQAQATRTWVSGVGDDVNPCSRTAPCKTFAGAISKTAAAGEINCLDPGGFGTLTITKSIAIVCDQVEAGVASPGTNGFTINAGLGDNIYISGVDIQGFGTGVNGINILQAGSVHVNKVTIRGFAAATSAGIRVAPASGAPKLFVGDSIIDANGGTTAGAAILVQPSGSGSVTAVLNGVQATNNIAGFRFDGSTTSGTITGIVRNSNVDSSARGGLNAVAGTASVNVLADSSSFTQNDRGVVVNGALANVRLTRSAVTANATGLTATGGTIASYGDNEIDNNVVDGSAPTPIAHR